MTNLNDHPPDHIMQSVHTIATLHDEHHRAASRMQKVVESAVRLAGRPRFAGVMFALMAAWVLGNFLVDRAGGHPLDPPPFPLLESVIGALALFLTILILITQRREYELEERRTQLSLQLALLAEQKNAKIIEMIETLLNAHPDESLRADPAASSMAKPVDSAALLSAIDERQREREP